MGWGWKDLNPIHAVQDAIGEVNKIGHKLFGGGPGHEDEGGTDWYVGYNNNNGFNAQISPGQRQIQNNTPQAYSRVTAATAKDIAQGGMTKDEVIEFNMKHPNETAKRS